MPNASKKIVFVGSSCVGKSCLIETFVNGAFPKTYVPKVCDTCTKTVEFEGKNLDLLLCYTQGLEDYNMLRPLSYPNTDVIVIVFGIDAPGTLEDVADLWAPEVGLSVSITYVQVNHHCSSAPIVLVGLRQDLRDNPITLSKLSKDNKRPVTEQEGKAMAERINACAYLECSAANLEGISDVFTTIAAATFIPTTKRRKYCCVQ